MFVLGLCAVWNRGSVRIWSVHHYFRPALLHVKPDSTSGIQPDTQIVCNRIVDPYYNVVARCRQYILRIFLSEGRRVKLVIRIHQRPVKSRMLMTWGNMREQGE